ncbi:prepilin-type N-terminal cleavage/methylation domain-containing protein [Candidatus Dojkabacteria bacterium]|nr:prepilin-type N-terminal cleavage/methylation domain-containing protein [Candidatus Dojkabacteria bacterium]
MKLPKYKSYKAFTLLEMLVVLVIFIVLSALSMAGFNGFRDTISLNQDIDRMKQDIRGAQRAALFLERKNDERWLYGIGIDFTQLDNDGSYRLFKWCAQFDNYGDIRSKQNVPNFDPNFNLSQLNSNLGLSPLPYSSQNCEQGIAVSEIVRLNNNIDFSIGSNFQATLPEDNRVTGHFAGVPAYLLFEAVSGKAFFYDINGYLVNYSSTGELVSSPINFVIEVRAPNTSRLKTITIFNISGKVKVEDERI